MKSKPKKKPEKTDLKSTAKNLKTFAVKFAELASPISKFLVTKKLTIGILCFALIGLIWSVIEVSKEFSNTRPVTSIELLPLDSGTKIKYAIFNVQYNPIGSDHIGISIWFERDNSSPTSNFRISTSDNIVLRYLDKTKNSVESIQLQYADTEENDYWFEFITPINENEYVLQKDFDGDMFGSSKSDLNFELHINDSSLVDNGELEVYICGLSDIDIVNIYPTPKEISAYCASYEFDTISEESLKYHGIHLKGENTNIAKNKEFSLVLISIFIGIFSSVIVEIILDFIRTAEST